MNEVETLRDRIDRLEMRLAYQDEVIEDLNAAMTEQWRRMEALARQVERLAERLQEAGGDAGAEAPEPPPPHY